MKLTATIILFAAATGLLAAEPATQPDAEALQRDQAAAVQTVQKYVEFFKNRQGSAGVEKHWDFDAFLASSFGDRLKSGTPEQLAEMRSLMHRIVGASVANPKVAEAMAKAKYTDFGAKPQPGGRMAVNFSVNFGDDKPVPNTLLLARRDDQWKIIDAGNSGGAMLSSVFKSEFEKSSKAATGAKTPLEFLHSVADQVKPAKPATRGSQK